MKRPWIPGGTILRQVKGVASLAIVIIPLTLVGCGDNCDCPGEGVWVRDCVGWIAPVCGTYCMEAGTNSATLIPDCCCEGSSGKPSTPTDPTASMGEPVATPWRPMPALCR
jgi:hypothetical protein